MPETESENAAFALSAQPIELLEIKQREFKFIPIDANSDGCCRSWTPEETRAENGLAVQLIQLLKVCERKDFRLAEAALRQLIAGLYLNEVDRELIRLGGRLRWE